MPKNRTLPAIGVALLIPLAALAQAPPKPAPAPAPVPAAAPASARPAFIPAEGSVQAVVEGVVSAPAPAVEPPTPAEKTIDDAVKAIEALKTVSGDLAQSVEMLDQKFEIKGRYRKGPEHRLYLYLKVSGLPDAGGEMLQVCDGKTLWDTQQILDAKYYRRLEIAPVLEKLKAPELDDAMRQAVNTNIGFAGPEELLKGLRKAVSFNQPATTATVGGKACLELRGVWKSREGLTGPNRAPIAPTAELPAFVPSLVIVSLGKADNWPYKIRLVGKPPSVVVDTRPRGPDGRPIGTLSSIQQVKPTVIELTYENVKFNTALSEDEFFYTPPNSARVDDQTQAVVAGLEQAIALQAAKKKADAAKAEDPLLKEKISVPIAPDSTPAAPPPLNPVEPSGALK